MKTKSKILLSILCSSLIIGGGVTTVYAFSSPNRESNIESDGVLHVQNMDGDMVTVASSDLSYLANEMDELEYHFKNGVIDTVNPYGIYFSNTGNPSYDANSQSTVVKPTCSQILDAIDLMYRSPNTDLTKIIYHVHIDGNYNEVTQSPIYTKDTPGGCYVAAGHTHNATGTCPSHIVHHPAVSGPMCGCIHTTEYGTCPNCGHPAHSGASSSSGDIHGYCHVSSGGTPAWDETIYDCGGYVNTWTFGCGKTYSTPECEIIDFDKDYTHDAMN